MNLMPLLSVSWPKVRLLRAIASEPATVTDLARRVRRDKGAVHRQLDTLVRAGLVGRAGKGRGRFTYVITRDGRAALQLVRRLKLRGVR